MALTPTDHHHGKAAQRPKFDVVSQTSMIVSENERHKRQKMTNFKHFCPKTQTKTKGPSSMFLFLSSGYQSVELMFFFGRKLSHFLLRSSLPCKLSQNKLNLFFNERPHLVYLPQYALCAAVIDSNCFTSSQPR